MPADLVDVYVEAGVDVLEVGLASAHPWLDGPVVRASMARARAADPRRELDRLLERLAQRRCAPRVLVMGYADASHPGRNDPAFWAGIDSALVVADGYPPLRRQIETTASAAGVALSSFLRLPFGPDDVAAARAARFYVMLQAATGVTGVRPGVDTGNARRIAGLRRQGVQAPILAGFGVSTGAQARALRDMGADGVVVGSAVLQAALAGPAPLCLLLRQLREGLDG